MKPNRVILLYIILLLTLDVFTAKSTARDFKVVGYYAGNSVPFDSLELSKLTHLIYCFGNLAGDEFRLRETTDTLAVQKLIGLKKTFPHLKIMVSLGGWGGCATCSEVFSREDGRKRFSASVRAMVDYFHVDGLDLDWEYPVVQGFPGHKRSPDDKQNFTLLLEEIRRESPKDFLLTFASGGYGGYIDSAIDWKSVVPLVDFINIMSYDLVHGYSTVSGHHTPLYSTPKQVESTDHAVEMMAEAGVPKEKIVIGAALYARVFRIQKGNAVDLYQPCIFEYTFPYKESEKFLSVDGGFELRFDTTAKAPYAIHKSKRWLATFDNERSISLKTQYALQVGLGGIMFWQLCDDRIHHGLLDVIHRTVEGNR